MELRVFCNVMWEWFSVGFFQEPCEGPPSKCIHMARCVLCCNAMSMWLCMSVQNEFEPN